MSPIEAPYKSEGVSAAEVGEFAKALDAAIYKGPLPSPGIRRESGLSLLNVVSAALKSEATGNLDELLDNVSSRHIFAVRRVISDSGVVDSAPTHRQRSEAQEIIRLLTE